ncbi:MAG TPA: hypothetical protein DCZ69_14195 [Syntrophobacteraceae bacterium]|nr:hypothetical protein [Syntrophobacteraceae bacterium]
MSFGDEHQSHIHGALHDGPSGNRSSPYSALITSTHNRAVLRTIGCTRVAPATCACRAGHWTWTLDLVTCNATCYKFVTLIEFKHKELERFFTPDTRAGFQAKHAERLRLILRPLHPSKCPQDMHLPGLDLHPLAGDRPGYWAVKVSGYWRIIFCFVGKDAGEVVPYWSQNHQG